jgi:Transposase DDE domain
MELTSFLATVFCLIDDWLIARGQRLRQRGPAPRLADSEVLTIECVGEFLGIDTDTGLYAYFCRHWGDWFPALGQVHRTTFTRQAANPWAVKQHLWQHLLTQTGFDSQVALVDSVPIPICRFARADRCRRLRELAAWGRDETAKQTYLGLRAHLRVCWPGVIVDGRLAPANLADQAAAAELLATDGAGGGVPARGWVVADRAYGSARLAEELAAGGVWLLAPPRGIARTRRRPPIWVVGRRRRVETVIGQLVARYHLKQVWARDGWHLWSRWLRKLLSHTMAVLLCRQQGLSPLRFADLVSA